MWLRRTNRALLALALLLALAAPARAVVALDACAAAQISNSSTATLDVNVTVGAGSERAIVAILATDNVDVTLTAFWDPAGTNQALALIPNALKIVGTDKRVEVWGRVAPTTGTFPLRVALSPGTHNLTIFACAFTGVDQGGGATSFPNGTSSTATGTAATLAVTSAVGDYTMAALAWISSTATSSLQTQLFNETALTTVNSAGSRGTGAATVTHGWTLSSQAWGMAGTNIKASSGGGAAAVPQRLLLGTGQ